MAKTNKKNEVSGNIFKNFFGSIGDFFVGVGNEIKRIRWPKFSDLMTSTGKVLFFCILFSIYFVLCDMLVSELLVVIGVGA